jgi:PBP1b-binding outer membrane lipoprotein LpoB
MNKTISVKTVIALAFVALSLAGCSTLQSAYDSTVDTVSGWMKSDEKK